MNSEENLKNYICSRYKSVRQFAVQNDLKYSTVVAMLSRGLLNSNIETVFEVCKALDISVEPLVKTGTIMELHNAKRIEFNRRIEALSIFTEIAGGEGNLTIDEVSLTPEELRILLHGMDCVIELIRKLRKDNEEGDIN